MLTRLWGKTALALATSAAFALVPAAGASAALIDTSACDGATLTQPFSQFGDDNFYKLAPGGDFEGSLSGWTLSGGAKKLAGGSAGAYSVSIPAGGSVTTAPSCVNAAYPSFRFFTKSANGLLGLVAAAKVDLVYHDNLLGLVALPAGVLLPSGQWKPTAPMLTLSAVAGLVSSGEAPLSIRITSLVGSPFGMGPRVAAILAAVALCIWFPAFANVHIAAGGDAAKPRARISAAIRAFGNLAALASWQTF